MIVHMHRYISLPLQLHIQLHQRKPNILHRKVAFDILTVFNPRKRNFPESIRSLFPNPGKYKMENYIARKLAR